MYGNISFPLVLTVGPKFTGFPHFFSRFDRVAEVVPVDQNSRESARKNYTYYKERGYVLEYHNINQA